MVDAGKTDVIAGILAVKPAQRTPEDVERLVTLLTDEPFFAGVNPTSLELLSACLGLQRASPGEAVLHVGELTDRLFLLLSGSCSLVRHSRREGFQPQPPQQLLPGQALCEALLVVSGRRSDVVVTVDSVSANKTTSAAEAAPPGEAGGADGSGTGVGSGDRVAVSEDSAGSSGALLMVLTRAAWNNMCAKAPIKPEYGEARTALLCCCARSLASSDPGVRTLEQAEDLAALLRLLPGMSRTSPPVLRAMSESVVLRQLPPGTILFEECTRAESEFVVLAGAVESHTRPRRQGTANRAALRSALRSAVAASRTKSAQVRPKSTAEGQEPKSIRQKIEEERRDRNQIKQSLVLQREGLRTPKVSTRPTGARAVEDEFKKWMLEFLTRKRSGIDTANNAAATTGCLEDGARSSKAGALRGGPSRKATDAWRRAVKALHVTAGDHEDGEHSSSLERKDTTLMEYERRKLEEAGAIKDVGNLLGGAAARKAYMRGLASKDGCMYAEDEEPEEVKQDGNELMLTKPGGVHWGAHDVDEDGVDVDIDEGEDNLWVRLTYLDRRFHVVRKAIRYIDAMEKVMGVAKQDSADNGKSSQRGNGGSGSQEITQSGFDGAGGNNGGDPDAEPDPDLLLLNAADDVAEGAGCAAGDRGSAAAIQGGEASAGPGPDDVVDDACEDHLEQLYGPCGDRVEAGHVAGELPVAMLDGKGGSKRGGGFQRARRAQSVIAGPSGADVLVVALDALRRGHDAARDDLVSERLAVLASLEPLRGLSDEHQSQLALGCTVLSLDAKHVIVRQGQVVDALYVVLEGEVRLLDDPDTAPSAAPPPQQPPGLAGGGGTAGGAGGGTASMIASESPIRTASGAATAGGKLMSLKVRRVAASLAALSLLGPGGSFGESVLGYPEDLEAATVAVLEASSTESAVLSSSQYLATAMTSRPTKLLVLPRSLLIRYGYLRSSLPPFAHMRREAVEGRRKQLQLTVQNRPAAAAAGGGSGVPASSQAATAPASSVALVTGGKRVSDSSGLMSMLQLPTLLSPTAAATAAAAGGGLSQAGLTSLGMGGGGGGLAMGGSAFQTPRPPPVRPMEVLEQLGIKPVLRRIYNAGTKPGFSTATPSGGGGGGNVSASTASSVNGRNGAPSAAASTVPSSCNSMTSGSNNLGPLTSLQHPPGNGGGGGGPDRQHRRDLLAASALAANNPQSLQNAIARARWEDVPLTALPPVLHSVPAVGAPRYRASSDGVVAATAEKSPGGVVLPMPFPSSSRVRPMRLSISGIGTSPTESSSPLPVRRASVSGVSVLSIPSLTSPSPPPRVGRLPSSFSSAPNPHVLSVHLPRLSGAGVSVSGSGMSTAAAAAASGRSRPSVPGEPFLVRLEAVDVSPRSFSPFISGAVRSISSSSVGAVGGGGGGDGTVPLLGQRSASQQPIARA